MRMISNFSGEEAEEETEVESAAMGMQPFRFLDLPFELRLRVYELILVFGKTIDLEISNHRTLPRLLQIFLVNHRIHKEAARVFYGYNTFRVFPIYDKFFHTKAPLLTRLPPRYRTQITKLELRLGPGWTKPPRGWVADGRLGLSDLGKMWILKVFIECDPASHPIFEGFRNGEDFYTQFSVNLMRSLIVQVPSIIKVEFDAYPSVSKSSPLLKGLLDEVKARNKRVTWGSQRGWDNIVEVDLASVMENLSIKAP